MEDENSSDSLSSSSHNNKATEVDDEIVQAFANADNNDLVSSTTSRASVDSQKSISFFVDLKDDNVMMARSAIVTPNKRISSGRRTKSQQGERMTQSMYVRSDSQSSGVSFFVDLTNGQSNKLIHSISREEPDHDLDELSQDMRVKSSLLLEQNLEQTKAFFKKLKDYVDFLATPSYSKEELRQKRRMAETISRVMFEEERKLKKGQGLSSIGELDQVLLGQPRNLRPVSAIVGSSFKMNPEDRPVLRRERTFDLEPKPSTPQLVEVNIDEDHEEPTGSNVDEQTLQMFQQQRLYHTMRLKREVAKLEKMEKEIAQKAAEIGPESRPKTSATRSCWTPEVQPNPERPARKKDEKTTFKSLHDHPGSSGGSQMFKLNMRTSTAMSDSVESTASSTSSYSWFIPGDSEPVSPDKPVPRPRPNSSYTSRSMGIQTGQSLMRQFQEKKDKACYVRDRPQAYFIECEGGQKQRPKSAAFIPESRPTPAVRRSKLLQPAIEDITTTIIDLETDSLPKEKELQEALRRKRPDYIANTKTREQDRLARSFVAANKKAVVPQNNGGLLKSKVSPQNQLAHEATLKDKLNPQNTYDGPLKAKLNPQSSTNGPLKPRGISSISHFKADLKTKIPTSTVRAQSETAALCSRPSSGVRSRPSSSRQKPMRAQPALKAVH